MGNIGQRGSHLKEKSTLPKITPRKSHVLISLPSLKQKNSTQEVKLNEQNLEIECLKQKNESLLNYTNEKLKEMLGNQKIIEINEKVFKDVKNYL